MASAHFYPAKFVRYDGKAGNVGYGMTENETIFLFSLTFMRNNGKIIVVYLLHGHLFVKEFLLWMNWKKRM